MLPQPTSCKTTHYSLKEEHRKPAYFLGLMGEKSKTPSCKGDPDGPGFLLFSNKAR